MDQGNFIDDEFSTQENNCGQETQEGDKYPEGAHPLGTFAVKTSLRFGGSVISRGVRPGPGINHHAAVHDYAE